jgi:hypothetical protein
MNTWYKKAKKNSNLDFDSKFLAELVNPWESIESEFIEAIAYYPLAKVLEVKIKGGSIYTFMGVSNKVYNNFKNAPSKGTFFNKVIKKRYKVTKNEV